MCAWSPREQGAPGGARRLGCSRGVGRGSTVHARRVLAEQSEQMSTTVTTTGLHWKRGGCGGGELRWVKLVCL